MIQSFNQTLPSKARPLATNRANYHSEKKNAVCLLLSTRSALILFKDDLKHFSESVKCKNTHSKAWPWEPGWLALYLPEPGSWCFSLYFSINSTNGLWKICISLAALFCLIFLMLSCGFCHAPLLSTLSVSIKFKQAYINLCEYNKTCKANSSVNIVNNTSEGNI